MALALAPVDSGLDFPVFAAAPPGDRERLFVVERGGRILLRRHGVRQAEPFLDLTTLTGAGHEFGVLGLAFHPQYASNRRFFVYYIDNDANGRLVEYRAAADGNHAEPGPVRELLFQEFPSYAIHYGGTIAFGPDGRLFFAMGDGQTGGSPSSPAQDSTSLLGKMLRLDVDASAPYAAPADNPFASRSGWRPEIYLLGLRNPYRWSIDRVTGDVYIGDVGERAFEEVTVVPAGQGANLGWPFMEGLHCYRPQADCDPGGLTMPAVEYYHGADACSVTGGVVYRGRAIPELRGTYLYGDFCGGWVRRFVWRDGRAEAAGEQLDTPPVNGAGDNVVGFGEDADGEVYVVMASGRLYRIVEAPTT